MDSDPVKDSALLRQMTAGLSSEMRELERETADIQAQIKETRAACDAVHAKNANLKTLNEFREKEISMLLAKNESLEKQIAEYTDVIRPQLQNELKQVKELAKAKEKKYRDMIEKYEKKWAEYEVLYNKWPRVAELNALREKVKLVKIECMKKEQEAKELRQQAEQVYQAKVERLETLKKKYLECYAENQQVILKRQQIEREVEEIKARVALKKAAHQKRLEEEKQRKAAEVQNSMLDVVESAASASPISTVIKLHRFNIPEFKINFNTPLPSKELMSFSQGSAMLRSSPAATYMDGGIRSASQPKPSTSSTTTQPNETATLTCSRENLQAPRAIHLNNSNVSEQLMGEVMEFSAGSKKLEDLVAPGQEIVEKPKSFKEVNNVICCSPLSKREVILSTDNIAARLRETIRPNLNVSEDLNKTLGPTSMTQSSRGSKVDVAASSTEVDLFSQEYRTSHQDTIEAIGIEEPEKVTNVNTVHLDSNQNMDQEKSSEPADFTGNSSDLSPCGENDNPPLEDDNCFDFNAEYGDEMYSLQSPPAFESAMSPAHAGFESSPSKNSEEAQSDVQDSGQPSASAFNAFSFFPKPSTANIFGGPSNSEQSGGENNKQSTSRFSFLF